MSVLTSLLALWLAVPAGHAGAWECKDCCREAGLAGCPTTLRVYGDGSLAEREGAAWRIKGMWRLDCEEGVRFDPGATAVVSETPRAGLVVRLASPAATVRCFEQTCPLPGGACLLEDPGEQFRLGRCSDGQPLSAAEMLQPPVISSAAPRIAPQTPPPREVVPLPEPIALGLTLSLPAAPSAACEVAEVLRAESRKHVALGDQARVAGQWAQAAQEYQAALTLDRCDAPAWSALGLLALRGGQWAVARDALQVATRLDPESYRGLTALGEAQEQLGASRAAAAAYRAALMLAPDHAPAAWGLARLGE